MDVDACLSEATVLRAFAVIIACTLLRDGEFQAIPVACWCDFHNLRNTAIFRVGIGRRNVSPNPNIRLAFVVYLRNGRCAGGLRVVRRIRVAAAFRGIVVLPYDGSTPQLV